MHERVADAHPRLPRRELQLVDQLVGELHSHELQRRLHEPVALSRPDGLAVAEHHAVPRFGSLGRQLPESDAHTEQDADVQQRQLWRVGRLVGQLHRIELQRRLR